MEIVGAGRFVRYGVDCDGELAVVLPGLPIAADGATLDEAVDEMVEALHDYAQAWNDRLRLAANHADNWGLVQIVSLPRITSCATGCRADSR